MFSFTTARKNATEGELTLTEEWNDVYDKDRRPTGRVHLRGTPWAPGDYGLVVCCWVYDGRGRLLLTRRAKEKSFPGTWENSGGAVKAGEDSLSAIVRELYEETGIQAPPDAFELFDQGRDNNFHYDFYCLQHPVSLKKIRLLPGETDDVMWASFGQIHGKIARGEICDIIGRQFYRQEEHLRLRNLPNFRR